MDWVGHGKLTLSPLSVFLFLELLRALLLGITLLVSLRCDRCACIKQAIFACHWRLTKLLEKGLDSKPIPTPSDPKPLVAFTYNRLLH